MRAAPWILLSASLALNAALLLRRAPAPTPPSPAAAPRSGAPEPSRLAIPPRPFGAIAGTPSRPAARDGGPAPAAAVAQVDDALIQDVLCTIAEQKLREGWHRDRASITDSLRKSLADRAGQERDVQESAAELAGLLDLAPAARDDFTRRYREKRLARVADGLAAVERSPPDYAALMGAAQGLFADEDGLARELGGAAGAERVRASMLEVRTTFLAIVAALGDVPDNAIRW